MSPKTKLIFKIIGYTAIGLAAFAYAPLLFHAAFPAAAGWLTTSLEAMGIGQLMSDVILASGVGIGILAGITKSVRTYFQEKTLEKKVEQIIEQKNYLKKQDSLKKTRSRPKQMPRDNRHFTISYRDADGVDQKQTFDDKVKNPDVQEPLL